MAYNPDIHHRRSIRLKNYDYSQQGAYFITICVTDKLCLFGAIRHGELHLNDAGNMVVKWYLELERKFPSTQCGPYIVMPNHFHAIIHLVGANPCVRPAGDSNQFNGGQTHRPAPTNDECSGIPTIVQWFKTMTTNEYIRSVKTCHWPPFPGRLWQRNYYEHIIRNEKSFHEIADYIINNPLKWAEDKLYMSS